ncbi:hypothetical protein TTMY_2411 [Thermus thermophilus]|nr:hypothetical protein TTMY_2411 [Thermus thermophilus]
MEEGPKGPRPKVVGRLQKLPVNPLHAGVDGEDEEGQEGVEAREEDRREGGVEAEGPEAKGLEEGVRQALLLQEDEPGVDPDEEVGEEGQEEKEEKQVPPGVAREVEGEGVAQEGGEQGGEGPEEEALREGLEVGGLEEPEVVVETPGAGKLPVRPSAHEGGEEDEKGGQEDEEEKPKGPRAHGDQDAEKPL